MLNISRRDVENALATMGSAHRSASRFKGHGEYVVGTFAAQAESGLSAFGYGALEGRFGPIKVGPVSADLLAAVLIHGAALLGVAGAHAGHAHNFAQGLMDGHLHRLGIGVGTAWGKSAGSAPAKVSGRAGHAFERGATHARVDAGGTKPLTAAEIAALAQRRAA